MNLFSVSYDLSKPGRDYSVLISAIKGVGSWCHALESTWIVSSDLSEMQVRDRLKPMLDANDQLLVVEMSGSWASYNLGVERVGWLKRQTA